MVISNEWLIILRCVCFKYKGMQWSWDEMRMTTHRVISTSGLLLSQDHLSPLAFRDVSSDHEHIQVVHIPLQQALIFMVAFKALINNCLNIWWHFLPQVFAREHRDNMQWGFAQCEAQRKILGHRALSQVWFSSLTRHLSLSFYQSRGSLLWTANVNFMGWTYRRIWRFFGIAQVCLCIFFLYQSLEKIRPLLFWKEGWHNAFLESSIDCVTKSSYRSYF